MAQFDRRLNTGKTGKYGRWVLITITGVCYNTEYTRMTWLNSDHGERLLFGHGQSDSCLTYLYT